MGWEKAINQTLINHGPNQKQLDSITHDVPSQCPFTAAVVVLERFSCSGTLVIKPTKLESHGNIIETFCSHPSNQYQ